MHGYTLTIDNVLSRLVHTPGHACDCVRTISDTTYAMRVPSYVKGKQNLFIELQRDPKSYLSFFLCL